MIPSSTFCDVNVSFFLSGGVHFDLVKRVLRDVERVGQTPSDILQQISDTVYPMFKIWIEPELKKAHIRVVNTFNPFSGFMSPLYILKSNRPADLGTIRKLFGSEVVEEEYNDIYLYPPGRDKDECNDWLRMRQVCRVRVSVILRWLTQGIAVWWKVSADVQRVVSGRRLHYQPSRHV